MAVVDFSLPKLTQLYNTELLPSIRDNQAGLARMFNGDSLLNTPDKTIRFNASQTRFEIYDVNASTWAALLPSYISSMGGTYTGNLIGDRLTLTSDLNVGGVTNGTGATFTGTLVASIFSVSSSATFGSNVILNGTALSFNALSQRIMGNFSSATLSERTTFQSAISNQTTLLQAMPNGTANQSGFTFLNSSTPANAGGVQLNTTGAFVNFNVVNYGTPTSTVATINFSFNTTSVLRMEPTAVTSIVPVVLPADPTTALQAATKQYVDSLSAGGHGQCQVTLSGSNILLSPLNGNKLITGNVTRTIPSGGITLAPAGVTPNTLYYLYAFWTGTALSLEYSTAVPSTDATSGVRIKTGDSSRTLVGMAYSTASSAWINSGQLRFVISYFNRRDIPADGLIVTDGVASTGFSHVGPTSNDPGFLTWGDEPVKLSMGGTCYLNTAGGNYMRVRMAVDTTTLTPEVTYQPSTGTYPVPFSAFRTVPLAEGLHNASIYALTSNGGVGAFISQSQMNVVIRG